MFPLPYSLPFIFPLASLAMIPWNAYIVFLHQLPKVATRVIVLVAKVKPALVSFLFAIRANER